MEPITVKELESHIRYLSNDLLEGRAVGTKGIEMAARYQEDYFKTMGLEPAFGPSFRQIFPLKGSKPDPQASLEFVASGVAITPVPWDEFVIRTERDDAPAEAAGDLVYCGFLVQAPERNWDDIKGMDLTGKVLLVEINEPGNYPGGVFDGEDMTYYGRWTYKFEKAAELGAAGVLIIHNTKGAAYGWDVLRNPWPSENFFLPEKNRPLFFQGWVTGASKTNPAVKSAWSRAKWQASAPDQEKPATIARRTPIVSSAARISAACRAGEASSRPPNRPLQPWPGRSGATTRKPAFTSWSPRGTIMSA